MNLFIATRQVRFCKKYGRHFPKSIQSILRKTIWQWMEHGFTITYQNHDNSPFSELKLVIQLRRRRNRCNRRERSWRPLFGMWKEFCCYLEMKNTVSGEYYYNHLTKVGATICENNRPDLNEKKKTFSIRTKHLSTNASWQCENSGICTMKPGTSTISTCTFGLIRRKLSSHFLISTNGHGFSIGGVFKTYGRKLS